MFKDDILYGGHEELEDRIKQLKAVIKRCAEHGDDAGVHVNVLSDLVAGMESILERYSHPEIM